MVSESRKKPIVKSMRINQEQYDEIRSAARELGVSDATLMRVGTIMLLEQLEDSDFDWTKFYKYAATT